MKSIIVNGRFYRSVRAFAEAANIEYQKVIIAHSHSGGRPYFFEGLSIRLATEEEAEGGVNGDFIGSRVENAARPRVFRVGSLIPRPITSGISTNWGDYV